MKREHRKDARYDNMGRVESDVICPLPGVLDDIILTGCRVHYPTSLTLDMENDYPLRLKVSIRGETHQLEMICHPQWSNISDESVTEIGFSFLRSPDTPALNSLIGQLSDIEKDDSDISDLLIETPVTLI